MNEYDEKASMQIDKVEYYGNSGECCVGYFQMARRNVDDMEQIIVETRTRAHLFDFQPFINAHDKLIKPNFEEELNFIQSYIDSSPKCTVPKDLNLRQILIDNIPSKYDAVLIDKTGCICTNKDSKYAGSLMIGCCDPFEACQLQFILISFYSDEERQILRERGESTYSRDHYEPVVK